MAGAVTCSASLGLFLETNKRRVAETAAIQRGWSPEERPRALQELRVTPTSPLRQEGRKPAFYLVTLTLIP